MIIFWIIIVTMIIVSLAFIIWPLLGRSKLTAPARVTVSIALYKERLQYVEQQKLFGDITIDEYNQLRFELEKSLLNDIPEVSSLKPDPRRNMHSAAGTWLIIPLLILVPLAALLLYINSGTFQQWASYKSAQEKTLAINAEINSLGSLEHIIAKLKQRVQENPDSRGWFLLGRLYMKNENFPEAVAAFAQAEQLSPGQPEIMLAHAEGLYFYNGHSLNQQAISLITATLKLHPNQPEAINLLAIDAYQHGKYQQAADYWQRLLSQFPPDSDQGKVLLRMIAEAQQHINQRGWLNKKGIFPISLFPSHFFEYT